LPSLGERASEQAVAWVAERRPDLVCRLLLEKKNRRGETLLAQLLEQLPEDMFVVLGNHDFAISRDPFSQAVQLVELARGRLLSDESVEVELRGVRIEVAGVDPRSWLAKRSSGFGPAQAPFRLLLCHFPRVLDRVDAGRWHLILSGHLHAGQIVLPYGRGKRLLLAHPRSTYRDGVYRRG